MTERTEVLDLFCGVGGATAGYLRAGLNVVAGVDVADQPDYPGHHVKGDAFAVLELLARASDEYGSDVDTAVYTLVDTQFNPADDRRLRQVFSTTIGVRNRLP
jgi:hypothetical protein